VPENPVLLEEGNGLALKQANPEGQVAADLGWKTFASESLGACMKRGGRTCLDASITDKLIESASLLAQNQQCPPLVLEVQAVQNQATAHAPCGHCIVQKQLDVTHNAKSLFSSPSQPHSNVRHNEETPKAEHEATSMQSQSALTVCKRADGSFVVEAWSSLQDCQRAPTKASIVSPKEQGVQPKSS
jgi:hypothetical protein